MRTLRNWLISGCVAALIITAIQVTIKTGDDPGNAYLVVPVILAVAWILIGSIDD